LSDLAAPWLAILNPRARRGAAERLARPHLDALRRRGVAVELVTTAAPRDAVRLAREGYARGSRRFLAIGGDGTAFEVLNGFLPAASEVAAPVELAVLPLGTGNSFVRQFGPDGSAGAERVVAAIAEGSPRPCDVLRLRHSGGELHALGTVSVGFPAQVSALVNGRLKAFGVLGYTLGVLRELARLRAVPSDLAYDDTAGRHRVDGDLLFAAIQNVEWVGGNMRMAPGARPDDGLADLVVVGAASRLRVLRLFPRIFDGRHVGVDEVRSARCIRVSFDAPDRRPVMLDGEVVELAPHSVELRPAAISIRA
jgi:diacylglycerol kinase (ATP)